MPSQLWQPLQWHRVVVTRVRKLKLPPRANRLPSIIKKDNKELNFKDNKGNIADWVAKLKAENKQEDLVAAGRTWQVYKNEYNYKVAYLTQIGEHVLRVGSTVEDPQDAEVLSVLAAVRDYDIKNY